MPVPSALGAPKHSPWLGLACPSPAGWEGTTALWLSTSPWMPLGTGKDLAPGPAGGHSQGQGHREAQSPLLGWQCGAVQAPGAGWAPHSPMAPAGAPDPTPCPGWPHPRAGLAPLVHLLPAQSPAPSSHLSLARESANQKSPEVPTPPSPLSTAPPHGRLRGDQPIREPFAEGRALSHPGQVLLAAARVADGGSRAVAGPQGHHGSGGAVLGHGQPGSGSPDAPKLSVVEVGAAQRGGLPGVQGLLETIQCCSHVLEVAFPLCRDSSAWEVVWGWHAQHSQHCLPCKRGEAASCSPTTCFSILTQPCTWGSAGLPQPGSGHGEPDIEGVYVNMVVVGMHTVVPRRMPSMDASLRRMKDD